MGNNYISINPILKILENGFFLLLLLFFFLLVCCCFFVVFLHVLDICFEHILHLSLFSSFWCLLWACPDLSFPLSFFFPPDAGAFMSMLRHDFPSFFQMLVPFMSMLRLDFPSFFFRCLYEHAQTWVSLSFFICWCIFVRGLSYIAFPRFFL